MLFEKIAEYLEERRGEFDRIESERSRRLLPIADLIRMDIRNGRPPQLLFVCTHNSRRSHIAQLWTAAAAVDLALPLDTWSGGTEATEFDHRAVAALQRAGFAIETAGDRSNDGYMVDFDSSIEPVRCFSKVHDRPPNPMKDFIAVMVCDEADRGCPHIDGASARFGIPYRDPKLADDTPEETSTYDERCRDVAREMLWMIEQAAASS